MNAADTQPGFVQPRTAEEYRSSRAARAALRRRAARTWLISALLFVALIAVAAIPVSCALRGIIRFAHPQPSDDWRLVLVNATYEVPDDWESDLVTLLCGEQVDARILDDLQLMMDACRADGLSPVVNSGYRSREDQQRVFDERVQALVDEGYPEPLARMHAEAQVAPPGHSEHELGLAVDICAERGYSDQAVYEWLAANSWRYGFVVRYPSGGEDVTGIEHEPWHVRYVGVEAAEEMHEGDLVLEEYLGVG